MRLIMESIKNLSENSDSKFCIHCDSELLLGVNWRESAKNCYSYICNRCGCEIVKRGLYRRGINKPMSENKTCSSYLGCHVAEQVLSKVFKDVEVMPPNHSGYDFICNNGKKIDVKSSTLRIHNRDYPPRWLFSIRKNKVADYFLCIGFDNREDLNPKHIWLLPSDYFSHKHSATISDSTIDKWKEYEIDINNVIRCCNKMKEVKDE